MSRETPEPRNAPTISIVIPVYREPIAIVRCLSWLASCPGIEECEIIVSEGDGGASLVPDRLPGAGATPGGSRAFDRAAGPVVHRLTSPAGRGTQLDAGARVARGRYLVFLHVDTRPPRGFVRAIKRSGAEAGAFDLHIETAHPIVRAVSLMGLLRSRITRIPYGDQVQFVAARAYRAVGGFPHVPIMEDVALMDRLKESGHRIAILRPPARTSDRRWLAEGAIRTTLRNWRIMLAYRSGLSPESLRGRYRPQSDVENRRDCLLIFHRALRPGQVKTRLAAAVGDEQALELYRAMLEDLAPATRLHGVRSLWFVDDPRAGENVVPDSVAQSGADLWDRMADAIQRAAATGARRVVLVGSDVPALDRSILRRAFALLGRNDLVVGPSRDGGFYLFGCRAGVFDRAVFDEASRSPRESAAAIRGWAGIHGVSVASTRTLRDVDTVDDLRSVLADASVSAPRLRARATALLGRRGR